MPIKYITQCKDVEFVKPIKSAKIGTKSDAVTMTSFNKNENAYDAHFSLKNNTDDVVTNIHYILIFKTTSGEVINYEERLEKEEIAPQLAKRYSILGGFSDWSGYSCNGETTIYNNRHPKFTVEFRLISYEIEE